MKHQKTVLIPLALLLCGCTNSSFVGQRIGCISNITDTRISSSYEKCNGCAIYEISVKESNSLAIKCIFTTEAGEINFAIAPLGNAESLIAKSMTDDAEYSVDLPSAGKYKITVNTNDHKGSYSFDWAK